MSFSECSVNIYQGQVPVPPTPPTFAYRHRVGVHVAQTERLQDVADHPLALTREELDAFLEF